MNTAAAMTLVHSPVLSPSAVCTIARVFTISPLNLYCCSRSNQAWDEREQQYKLSGEIVKTRAIVQTAEGDKTGLWTRVIAAAVFILESPAAPNPEVRAATESKSSVVAASGSGSLLNPK